MKEHEDVITSQGEIIKSLQKITELQDEKIIKLGLEKIDCEATIEILQSMNDDLQHKIDLRDQRIVEAVYNLTEGEGK